MHTWDEAHTCMYPYTDDDDYHAAAAADDDDEGEEEEEEEEGEGEDNLPLHNSWEMHVPSSGTVCSEPFIQGVIGQK